jgi:hypothetical protein
MDLRKKDPRQDDGSHPAGVNQGKFEVIRTFNIAENPKFLKQKLQRRFQLSPAYACVVLELAFFAGWPR